ncbi:Testis anion transporter 1 [Myotis brandtii]|uniref:Testis anion transporter 1 n=1 Tax=Myotis brandtii TaxID=109478 RepID=S7NIQ3_MYOBR|nr:Testis anion transporter 1 [Myotis brandtii]
MGMLGFGFIATYLPEAAINAYLTAVALHIIVSQMTSILGVMISFHAGPTAFFYVLGFSALASKISIATDSGKTFMDMIPYRLMLNH